MISFSDRKISKKAWIGKGIAHKNADVQFFLG